MCGIAGFVDFGRRRSGGENGALARAMGDRIRHRGPDAGTIWSCPDAGLWLSHRRLAIVDLSEAGAQPMSTPDGGAQICFNGEAYNAADLRPELEAVGYRFRGHSDTEVVLYACRHWGVAETAKRLTGMFAFAYWDGQARILSLVRDRLGKKPIYWFHRGGSFVFASELRPLLAHPDCPRDVDRSSVAEFLRTHYIAAPHSIIAGVEKVAPGAVLTLSFADRTVGQKEFWSLRSSVAQAIANPFTGSPNEAIEATEALILDATRIRLVSDVPLGAFLSGGIDSSTVVAMMQEVAGGRTRTFSIGYSDKEYDEAADAERVAAHLGTDHSSFIVEPADAMAVIPDLPSIFDEPFADVSQIPTYLVSKLARQHVTVALTGDGGDEVFAGYNRHVAAGGLLRRLRRLPRPLRVAMARTIETLSPDQWQAMFQLVPAGRRPRSVGEKLHKLAPLLLLNEREQYHRLTSHWINADDIAIGGVERSGEIDTAGLERMIVDPVALMRFMDIATYLPGDILTKVDRASMAASLETRAPLLDHRLVEWSFRVPSAIHLRNGQGKWLLRQILERRVPRTLFERPKSGFGIPVGDWLRRPLRDWAEDLLSERRLSEDGLVRPGPVRAVWAQHLAGKVNAQYQLWPVLMLTAWYSAYRDQRDYATATSL